LAQDALEVLIDEPWRAGGGLSSGTSPPVLEAIPHSQLMFAIEERIVDRQV